MYNNSGSSQCKMSEKMKPISPIDPVQCDSIEDELKKCPKGMFVEINYGGERIQIQKVGDEFKYLSDNSAPVENQIDSINELIPKAFPEGQTIKLDGVILTMESVRDNPGLQIYKLFKEIDLNMPKFLLLIIDCMFYNGRSWLNKALKTRRKQLKEIMKEIPEQIALIDTYEIRQIDDLNEIVAKTLRYGVKGLIFKDIMGHYNPDKSKWFRVDADYFVGNSIKVDLILLGAWYSSSKTKEKAFSIFLMGCYDEETCKYCTVTKAYTGYDQTTLGQLTEQLDFEEYVEEKTSIWFNYQSILPSFVIKNPSKAPVWEITGSQLENNENYYSGITMKFPRLTNKLSLKKVVSLNELKDLFNKKITPPTNDLMSLINGEPLPSTSQLTNVPLYFQGVKLLLQNGVAEIHSESIRYFIAYGGIVLNLDQWQEATHVLHIDDSVTTPISINCPNTARHVIVEWIKHSVERGSLQNYLPYTVRWRPSLLNNLR